MAKVKKAFLGLAVEGYKKAKESGAKGLEFLSPLAMVARIAKGDKTKYSKNTESADQKKTGSAQMNMGGEVSVGKGGEYIKDLID